MSDTAFSPAVSVYSSLRAALKFAERQDLPGVTEAIQVAMAVAWEALSEADQERWFKGER